MEEKGSETQKTSLEEILKLEKELPLLFSNKPYCKVVLSSPSDVVLDSLELKASKKRGIKVVTKKEIKKGEDIIQSIPFVKFETNQNRLDVKSVCTLWFKLLNEELEKLEKEDSTKKEKIIECLGNLYPRTIEDAKKNLKTAIVAQFGMEEKEKDALDLIKCVKISLNSCPFPGGYGIYEYCSKVNHSCDPNCLMLMLGERAVIKTIRDVSEGEEITIPYIMSPFTKEFQIRKTTLTSSFGFECKCRRCNWESAGKEHIRKHKEICSGIIDTDPHCFFKGCEKKKKEKHRCSTCGVAAYCSKKHLNMDYERNHIKYCKDF